MNGFLSFGPTSVNVNDFGVLNPVPQTHIATGNSYINVDSMDSYLIQAILGEEISVEAILQAVSGTTMRASFENTATFNLSPITTGVSLNVVPLPEPSTALLLGLGLTGLGEARSREHGAPASTGAQPGVSGVTMRRRPHCEEETYNTGR